MMKDRTRELSVQQLPCRFYGGDYKSRADRDGMAKFAFTRFLIPAFVRSGFGRILALRCESQMAKDFRLATAGLIDNYLEEYDIAPKILSLRAAKSRIIFLQFVGKRNRPSRLPHPNAFAACEPGTTNKFLPCLQGWRTKRPYFWGC
jgi:hypothetical protein